MTRKVTYSVQHITIAQSEQVSGDIDISGAELLAVFAPVVTSCEMRFQGNYDTTSAGFVRMGEIDGTGDWTWALGAGSLGVTVTDIAHVVPFGRIELSVPQDALRSLAVISAR